MMHIRKVMNNIKFNQLHFKVIKVEVLSTLNIMVINILKRENLKAHNQDQVLISIVLVISTILEE